MVLKPMLMVVWTEMWLVNLGAGPYFHTLWRFNPYRAILRAVSSDARRNVPFFIWLSKESYAGTIRTNS